MAVSRTPQASGRDRSLRRRRAGGVAAVLLLAVAGASAWSLWLRPPSLWSRALYVGRVPRDLIVCAAASDHEMLACRYVPPRGQQMAFDRVVRFDVRTGVETVLPALSARLRKGKARLGVRFSPDQRWVVWRGADGYHTTRVDGAEDIRWPQGPAEFGSDRPVWQPDSLGFVRLGYYDSVTPDGRAGPYLSPGAVVCRLTDRSMRRIALPSMRLGSMWAAGATPDGRILLASTPPVAPRAPALIALAVDAQRDRTLQQLPCKLPVSRGYHIGGCKVAPDGRHIAWDIAEEGPSNQSAVARWLSGLLRHGRPAPPRRHLLVARLNGSAAQEIAGPGSDRAPFGLWGWTRDGRHLLVGSYDRGIWSIPIGQEP